MSYGIPHKDICPLLAQWRQMLGSSKKMAPEDLEAMAEMERVVVDGGLLLLAVPVGAEALIWNAHRVYGRKRLAMLLHRWRVLHRLSLTLPDMTCLHDIPEAMFDRRVYAPEQPLFVLQNTRPEGITGISHASLDIE